MPSRAESGAPTLPQGAPCVEVKGYHENGAQLKRYIIQPSSLPAATPDVVAVQRAISETNRCRQSRSSLLQKSTADTVPLSRGSKSLGIFFFASCVVLVSCNPQRPFYGAALPLVLSVMDTSTVQVRRCPELTDTVLAE